MCYSTCRAQKITNSRRFYPSFILVKHKMETKMATTFGDDKGLQQRYPR